MAGAGGRRGPLPAAAAQRLQRAPLPARRWTRRRPAGRRSSRSAPTAGCSRRRSGTTPIEVAPAERFDVVVDFAALPGRHRGDADQRARARQHGRGDAVPGRPRGCATTAAVPDAARRGRAAASPARAPPCASGSSPAAAAAARRLDDQRHGRSTRDRMDARPALGRDRDLAVHHRPAPPRPRAPRPSRCCARGGRGARAATTPAGRTPSTSAPTETVEVAVRFTEHAGRYMLHCHNLEHEDMAMMAAFETVS